jgi:hypothetical protein
MSRLGRRPLGGAAWPGGADFKLASTPFASGTRRSYNPAEGAKPLTELRYNGAYESKLNWTRKPAAPFGRARTGRGGSF